MQSVEAVVKEGYRVASGTSTKDPTFNATGGTIRMQLPEFKKRGLDLDAYFGGQADEVYVCGTLGLSVAPLTVAIQEPEHYFENVRWTDKFDKEGQPPFLENFYLSAAEVVFRNAAYKALLYIPDPKTKPGHFQPPTTVEVIAQKIPGIRYGDRVMLRYRPEAVKIA
jgi:hypothetical protein